MKKSLKLYGVITLVALMVITTVSCGKSLNSAEDLKAYLDKQPDNSPDKPIKIAMKLDETMFPKVKDVINDAGKYVSLDLSGSPITTIPENAFVNVIDGEVIKMFEGCKLLVGIIIPKSVTSIGNIAFYGCTSLAGLIIPNSVTNIGDHAFMFCESLTKVPIGNGVTTIGSGAFIRCKSLTDITIEKSVTNIGDYAFMFCESLTSVTIPDSVTTIGYSAFQDCTSLTSVTFATGSNIKDTDLYYAFPEGDSLMNAYKIGKAGTYTREANGSTWTKQSSSSNKSASKKKNGGGKSINSADELKKYLDKQPANSPNKPIKIAMKLNEPMFPKVKEVINEAGKYISLDLSGSPITTIPENAFTNCKLLAGIIIPDGVTIIGGNDDWWEEQGAFYGCANLTSVTIPDTVTSIGEVAFLFCDNLTSVTFQCPFPNRKIYKMSFDGDLVDKYLKGGVGTYTRAAKGDTWTKQ